METIPQRFDHAARGLTLSHAWIGYGSTLFVEFGKLSQRKRRNGSAGNPAGELTLMIQWSWRIEKPRSVLGGSWSSQRRWPAMIAKLVGASVTGIRAFGALPEIEVSLSNGMRVVSFMTAEGQPSWSLNSRKLGESLLVKRGKLHVEASARGAKRMTVVADSQAGRV